MDSKRFKYKFKYCSLENNVFSLSVYVIYCIIDQYIKVIIISLTCRRSCCCVNKYICSGTSQKIPNAQANCIIKKTLFKWLLIEYINSTIINPPFTIDKYRNILSRIICNFVAVRGRGQQQANNKSIFRKAITLSNVGAIFILYIAALISTDTILAFFSQFYKKLHATRVGTL